MHLQGTVRNPPERRVRPPIRTWSVRLVTASSDAHNNGPVRTDRATGAVQADQLAVAGTQWTAAAAERFRMAAKLCRAGLMRVVNHERRCSASAAATAGISMQCTVPARPRRCRPVWMFLVPNELPSLA